MWEHNTYFTAVKIKIKWIMLNWFVHFPGLVQEGKDGKKKAPPPPPPPPLPPLESSSSSLLSNTQHLITMYSSAPKLGQANSTLSSIYPSVLVPNSSVSVGTSVNYISASGNAGYASTNSSLPPTNRQPLSGQGYNIYPLTTSLKNQTYGSFPAGLGTKVLPNNGITCVKGTAMPSSSVAVAYQSSTVSSRSCKTTQKYLLTTPPPPPPPPLPPPPPSSREEKQEIRQAYTIIEYLKRRDQLRPKKVSRDIIQKEHEEKEYKGVG